MNSIEFQTSKIKMDVLYNYFNTSGFLDSYKLNLLCTELCLPMPTFNLLHRYATLVSNRQINKNLCMMVGLDYSRQEIDENIHYLQQDDIVEIFLTNAFYLYTLPFDKCIVLIENFFEIYKILLSYHMFNQIITYVAKSLPDISLETSCERMASSDERMFHLQPLNHLKTPEELWKYQHKLPGIIQSMLIDYQKNMISSLVDYLSLNYEIISKQNSS